MVEDRQLVLYSHTATLLPLFLQGTILKGTDKRSSQSHPLVQVLALCGFPTAGKEESQGL